MRDCDLERLDSISSVEELRSFVWAYSARLERDYPWRSTTDPWEVLVSEVMLQQTQTSRVVKKYPHFISRFPVPLALAQSSVEELLTYWKGLGYNRRGLNLKQCAQGIVDRHGGSVPNDEQALRALPGIGPYTAAAVRAFAFSEPVVLIETNIRRLFLYVFFRDREGVPDSEVLELVEEALDVSDPRGWYSALMDLGSDLGSKVPNPNRKSKHYTKQSRFEGSNRQIRGRILDALLTRPRSSSELFELPFERSRIRSQLVALESEGFLEQVEGEYRLR